jgi:prepilin signal peptidase PulO-like enzyme (type II secretory pathway)
MWLNLIFALLGLLLGMVINALADFLPAWRLSRDPALFKLSSSAIWQQMRGGGERKRPLLVELATLVLYTAPPSLIPNLANLLVNSFHIAVLILIIVIDLEHRFIFDVVTYPATLLALGGSFLVTNDENTIGLAAVGAVAGFVVFGILYALAQLVYGTGSVALGAGDVKLSLAMGAMLGFHRILFALALGIVIGGVTTLLLLLSRRVTRQSHLPYGQYLAAAGIIMLIWGAAYAQQFIN